jgi:hypothetical protein
MKLTDIIRDLIDLIDTVEKDQYADPNRSKQTADLTDKTLSDTDYVNTPDEQYADIKAVTTNAGGGMHAPKNPADIRGDHTSLYPAAQWRGK